MKISLAMLIKDFAQAVDAFELQIARDVELKQQVDSRMPSLFISRFLEP